MDSIYLLVFISAALFLGMIALGGKLTRLKANIVFVGVFATIIGLVIGTMAYLPLSRLPGIFGTWLPVVFYLISVSISLWIFITRRKTIEETFQTIGKIAGVVGHIRDQVPSIKSSKKSGEKDILVDTSVLIDGRIEDIARTGFVPGRLILTRFVLSELQNIADSEDPLRRAKGRRGLDVVQSLKKELGGGIKTVNDDVEGKMEVDLKLVTLAKKNKSLVITNDFNLNKVAKIEGVRVLNINELSQAVRPVIIPGEELLVEIIQKGKERNQGVGYLPDGTMIVVEDGDKKVGQKIKTVIKRVLQTQAGKMYFATIKDKD